MNKINNSEFKENHNIQPHRKHYRMTNKKIQKQTIRHNNQE